MQNDQPFIKYPFLHGLGLAFQFLTIIPIRRSFEWNRQTAGWSILCYPMVGIVIGILAAVQALVLMEINSLSVLVKTMYVFAFSFLISGGLHLDGWMDCSDAYFSRGSLEKKLEIMKDSRVGAFGVLSVLFLFCWRFVFIYEIITSNHELIWILFFLIPFLSRTGMAGILVSTSPVRKSGMAFALTDAGNSRMIFSLFGYIVMVCLIFVLVGEFLLVMVLTLTALVFMWVSRRFFIKQFTGITGDMLGACLEGAETWLWFVGWLLLCFVMA
jgi:adenosylcobinamide-GDP ribazoletransferase